MLKDAQGLDVTTNSAIAIAAIDRYVDHALGYDKNILDILKGIEADPTCAIAYAHAAAHYLSLETAVAWQQAKPYLQAAKKYAIHTTEREQLYIEAIAAWGNGDLEQAIAYYEEITDKYPRDIAAVQRGQYHYFYLGNQEGLLKIAEKVLPANPNNHYLYGMLAFGLEQYHQLEQAEAWGRKAVEINRRDPWAQHAVAHVMETQGRIEEGIAWLESFTDTWENCNTLLYTHNWWHVALYYLKKPAITKTLELYDQYIWGRADQGFPKDQVNAIALLLRLELKNVDVGDRWQKLAPHLKPRIHEHALPFQDLHYVYALAKAGKIDLAIEMLSSMEAYTKRANPYIQKTWREVALPVAKGMIAHALGNWKKAIAELGISLPRLSEVGGSHAQLDLFEQVYLYSWSQVERDPKLFYQTA